MEKIDYFCGKYFLKNLIKKKMKSRKEENEIINALSEVAKKDPKAFYKSDVLARRGYEKVCLKFIEDSKILEEIKNIKPATREERYKNHTPENAESTLGKAKNPSRGEERLVLKMFTKEIDGSAIFGELLDYQIPLKDKQDDGYGKIDFISRKDGFLLLVEIKAEYNQESILKALFEIETYFRIVDKVRLQEDFGVENLTIKKVVAIFEKSKAETQYSKSKEIQKLAKDMDIEVIILKYTEKIVLSKLTP